MAARRNQYPQQHTIRTSGEFRGTHLLKSVFTRDFWPYSTSRTSLNRKGILAGAPSNTVSRNRKMYVSYSIISTGSSGPRREKRPIPRTQSQPNNTTFPRPPGELGCIELL